MRLIFVVIVFIIFVNVVSRVNGGKSLRVQNPDNHWKISFNRTLTITEMQNSPSSTSNDKVLESVPNDVMKQKPGSKQGEHL